MNINLKPPYYAVIFSSIMNPEHAGYEEMAMHMDKICASHPGFLGMQTSKAEDGLRITISYWKTLEDIASWKSNSEHLKAQSKGKTDWYSGYEVRICKVERQYGFGELK